MSYNEKEQKLAKKSHKNHLRKKWLIIIAIIFVAIVGGYLIYKYLPKNQVVVQPVENSSTSSSLTISEQAARLASNGDYNAGQKLLDGELAKRTDDTGQVDIYIGKAVLSVNNKNYDDAFSFALKAEDIAKSRLTSRLIAQIAEKSGDKAKAIEYYQLTLNRYSEEDKTSEVLSTSYGEDLLALQELNK